MTIANLDEKQTKIVLWAGAAAAALILVLVIINRLRGGSAATAAQSTAPQASSTQPPAILEGVTEMVYAAPGNLGVPPTPPTIVTPPMLPPRQIDFTTPQPMPLPIRQAPPPMPAPTPQPAPAPTQAPAPTPQRTFVVKPWPQPGSSLWSIAGIEYNASNQTNVDRIAAANHIANENLIFPGQVLVIP